MTSVMYHITLIFLLSLCLNSYMKNNYSKRKVAKVESLAMRWGFLF